MELSYVDKLNVSYIEDYSFFGLPFTLLSDSEDIIQDFRDIYRRFRNPPPPSSSLRGEHRSTDSISIYLLKENRNRPVLITPEDHLSLGGEDIPSTIYLFILNYVFKEVLDYFIIHGGVVEKEGKGVIISASSSVGKTTLILELLKRGFPFLSDELAPVGRNTGLIEPFPRSIGIRSDTSASPTDFKEMADISDIPGGKIGNPCPPGIVIFLSPPLKDGEDLKSRIIELAFSRIDEELIKAIERTEGIVGIERLDGRAYPTLRLTVLKMPVIERIEDKCRNRGIFILNSHWGISEPSDYTAYPRIQRLEGSSGLIELQKHLLNGRPPSRLSREFGNRQSRIMMDLADIFAKVSFYRLTIGRLKDMGDMVEGLVS